ncbi:hypothetical protein [Phaeodactylibacter xiamenensis]|uniref:hypothetical protein n=1 Tax=Phaeodactylibacter xiamenensis TaxID=1524460 RepID=UPI0024A8EB58|nr:hypothetical protein [Phaeodactylibacter xiamenensis]
MGKSIAGKAFSIRFFLNKSVKPRRVKGKEEYALYAQVNYDYKNTKVPIFSSRTFFKNAFDFTSAPKKPIYLEENFFDRAIKVYHDKRLYVPRSNSDDFTFNTYGFGISNFPIAAENIEKIARLENAGKGFSLSGLGKRLQLYYKAVGELLHEDLTRQIDSVLGQDYVDLFLLDSDDPTGTDGSDIFSGMSVVELIDWMFADTGFDFHRSVPEFLRVDIELLLLLAGAGVDKYPLVDWLNDDKRLTKFGEFLEHEWLFDTERELRIDLENYFSRYISLVPPSQPKEFYMERTKELISEQTKSIQEKK